jgi:NAD(P)H-dependent flavin oxidoreductase YrpB (nitropropane dioxygenase family)
MFNSKLTDLLGTEYPILGGTMMDLSMAPFVTAISEAGALGIIASAIYLDEDSFRNDLKAVKGGTDKPYAVNINLFPMMRKLDNNRYLEIMVEEGVKIVETSGFSPPEDLVKRIKDAGMVWIHKCVGVRYAKTAARLGADAVTVVGFENGGATGKLNVATLILLPSTVDAVDIPVIGGGGIVDGRTLLAAAALGASGAIVGTRLMLADECPIHADLKQSLLSATELDTDVIMRPVGFAHRVWLNDPAKKVMELEAKGADFSEIYPLVSGEAAKKMYDTGDSDAGTVSCSQGIGLIKKVMPLRDIFAEMMGDAQSIYDAMGK